MSILIDHNTKILVQGITGSYGKNQSKNMISYKNQVIAGVSPTRGGSNVYGVPVYSTVKEAVYNHTINVSAIYVPASHVKEAAIEAMVNEIKLIFITTEGVPLHDSIIIKNKAKEYNTWIIGPNSLGVISPSESLLGSVSPSFSKKGNVGLISRSGTLSIEFIQLLSSEGIGQSTVVDIGGDAVIGKNIIDYLKLYNYDPHTKAVVLIGEIGGERETEIIDYLKKMRIPVYVFIAGISAPEGRRMGHVGAIVSGTRESADYKKEMLKESGAFVFDTPWDLVESLKKYK